MAIEFSAVSTVVETHKVRKGRPSKPELGDPRHSLSLSLIDFPSPALTESSNGASGGKPCDST